MTKRAYLTQREKVLMIAFQDGRCAIASCHARLIPGHFQFDHTQALVHGGEAKPDRAICNDCHRKKTKQDIQDKFKVDRLSLGKSKRNSRPMPGTKASGWRRRMDGTVERR